jgi:hypothetical protein
MEDFDDFLEDDLDILQIIDFDFPRFQYTRFGRFHELDAFKFYSRFRLTKASALHFLILIEEEIEFPADT